MTADLLDKGFHFLLARWCLRGCDRVGSLPRSYGRPRLFNRGTIRIGGRFLVFNQPVRTELVSQPGGRIEIGDRVFLNYGVSISAHELVAIGNECQIGSYACLMDNDYHQVADRSRPAESAPIVLEDNVWLAIRVIVLKGVTIGANSVIGAGSVVTKDIPPNCLAAGVPAKVIRKIEDAEGAAPS